MKTLNYLNINSTQTLREAVFELRSAEKAGNDASVNVVPELLNDIDEHDAIHVLFGCSTNLFDEIIAHVWTLFGTTMKLSNMARVNMHKDHRQVLSIIGHRRLLKAWLRNILSIVTVIYRSIHMNRRWPAEQYTSFLDQRLCDIRKEYGIHPLASSLNEKNNGSGSIVRNVSSHEC